MKKLLILVAVGIATLVAAPAAGAVDIQVNTTDDDYGNPPATCSLREAITSAQTNSAFGGCAAGLGSDSIKLPAGTYKITRAGAGEDSNVTGDFDVVGVNALVIEPASSGDKVVVDANGLDRAFDQQGASSLLIQNIQVLGGKTTGIGEDGAAILNSSGTLSLNGTTVSGNASDYSGGGVAVYSNLSMVNSTVSGNSAQQNGGGLYLVGGVAAVKSSTITGNTADANADENGDGGGFYDNASVGVNFFNVIDAANVDSSPTPANKTPDCYSNSNNFSPRFTLSSQDLGVSSCLGFISGTNKVAPDPMLDPLADNGGQTPTHALILGSPAIAAGGTAAPDTCPPTDQNGRDRPADSCDIGAVQYFVPIPPPPPPPDETTELRIVKIKPKPLKLKRGKGARKVRVVFKTTGPEAEKFTLCLKPNRKTKKAIKIKSKRCLKLARVDGKFTKKFKLAAKRGAKKKKYKIKVVANASNAKRKTGKIVIKVKR